MQYDVAEVLSRLSRNELRGGPRRVTPIYSDFLLLYAGSNSLTSQYGKRLVYKSHDPNGRCRVFWHGASSAIQDLV